MATLRNMLALSRAAALTQRQNPSSTLRSSFAALNTASSNRHVSTSPTRSAAQDYGSGDGDPKGENPAAQGENPSAHIEHPGPEAPDVGKGSSGMKAAQPKIHSDNKPDENSEHARKHNEELRKTKGTSHGHHGETVSKNYWKGEGDA